MEENIEGVSVIDVILRWRKFVYRTVGIGTLCAIVVVLFLPNEYITFSTIKGGGDSGLNIGKLMQSSGALSALGSIADMGMPSSGGQVDYLVALLNTKTVQDSVIAKFDLKNVYKTKKIEDTREMLNINTVIKKNLQADILSVGVYGEQPDVAMEMTRYYVTMLSKLYTAVNEQTARNNREHLERRYEETILQLNRSEDSLRLFQEKFGVYDIEVQTSTAIKAAAELKSEILLKEVEYGAKQRVYGANSEELRQLASMIQLLNKKEEEMFDGKTSEAATSLFIPFKKTPALGVAYFRLYRNVKIYGELLKVLAPMLEQARLQEKRESPSIVVVDDATRPEKKSRPARSMIVLAVFMGLLSVSFLYILVVEHFAKIKATDEIRYNALVAFFKTPYRDFMAAVGKRKETAVR